MRLMFIVVGQRDFDSFYGVLEYKFANNIYKCGELTYTSFFLDIWLGCKNFEAIISDFSFLSVYEFDLFNACLNFYKKKSS